MVELHWDGESQQVYQPQHLTSRLLALGGVIPSFLCLLHFMRESIHRYACETLLFLVVVAPRGSKRVLGIDGCSVAYGGSCRMLYVVLSQLLRGRGGVVLSWASG